MELKSTRRIVTGHDADGKAVVLFDEAIAPKVRGGVGVGFTVLWVTSEMPPHLDDCADRAETPVKVPPLRNGSTFRIVDFPPAVPSAAPVDHHKVLQAMGIDPETQGYSRHANTHRTASLDYAIVIEGEIDLLMDDCEVHMKAGDVLVQQGTNHAWVNNSGGRCRVAFVLIDAKTPEAWRKGWTK